MGECLITRRGGGIYKLPVLDASYPQDVTTTVIKDNTGRATFRVVSSEQGSPAEYSYQWYVNGIAVEGATSSSYVKDDLTETAVYSVYCEVKNKKGVVTSRVATLNVTQLYTPVLNSNYPAEVTVFKDSSVTSKVEISTDGNPASYTYQWYQNGSAVSGATSPSYTFTPSVGSTTVYCNVTNDAGTVSSRTAVITVKNVLTLIPGSDVFANKVTSGGFQEVYDAGGPYHIYIERTGGVAVPIDVTGFNTMEIQGEYGYAKVLAWTGLFHTAPEYDNIITGFHSTTYDGESFHSTFDISGISGVVYFGIATNLSDAERPSFHANLFKVVFRE